MPLIMIDPIILIDDATPTSPPAMRGLMPSEDRTLSAASACGPDIIRGTKCPFGWTGDMTATSV